MVTHQLAELQKDQEPLSPETIAASERLGSYALRLLLWNGKLEEVDRLLIDTAAEGEAGWLIHVEVLESDGDNTADYQKSELTFELWGPDSEVDGPEEHYQLLRGEEAQLSQWKDDGLQVIADPQAIYKLTDRIFATAAGANLNIQPFVELDPLPTMVESGQTDSAPSPSAAF